MRRWRVRARPKGLGEPDSGGFQRRGRRSVEPDIENERGLGLGREATLPGSGEDCRILAGRGVLSWQQHPLQIAASLERK
jgi:hypothetical protein